MRMSALIFNAQPGTIDITLVEVAKVTKFNLRSTPKSAQYGGRRSCGPTGRGGCGP
jgi:hypothetical protein